MAFLIDSCIILDIFTNDPVWADASQQILEECDKMGSLYINPVIYTEVSIGYSTIKALDEAIKFMELIWRDIPKEALFLTGKVFLQYRRNKGNKNRPMPDFYIAAHAQVEKLKLVTRDTARYQTYFPNIALIVPGKH